MTPVVRGRLRSAARALLRGRAAAPRDDAVETVERCLRAGTPEALAAARAVVSDLRRIATPDLGPLAGRFLVTGDTASARALVDEAARRGPGGLTPAQRTRLNHLRAWTHPAEVPPVPPDAVRLGVLDYRQPDRTRMSKNVGDYVQTLALLGNFARFTDVEFSGADGLGELAEELQARVQPHLRIPSPRHRVHLLKVSRDFSAGDDVPDGTWLLAFGWHMHSSYRLRFGLPYHPSLRPLFVSFHLNTLEVLDEATLEYLRRHGPIGCRDWTTVDLLLGAGVDAFFTGCLTSTVDGVFPPLASLERSGVDAVGVIDLPDKVGRGLDRPVVRLHNADPRHRDLDVVSGTHAAIAVLEDYRHRLARIITGRLHSYLPGTSLGIEVDFRPKNPSDVRFPGLAGLHPASPDLEAMRSGLRDLLGETLGQILSGASPDEVYATWRSRASTPVADARVRHHAPAATYPPVPHEAVSRRTFAAPSGPHPLEVALVVEPGERERLLDAVHAVIAAAPGPVRVWVLSRGPGPELAGLPVTYVDLAQVPAAGEALLLPALLPEVGRVVVLGVADTAVDLARLAGLDLQGRPVGAHLSSDPAASTWRRAADRLAPEAAAELRRLMSARHPFAVRGLAPGALVMDLERMRADDALNACLALTAAFGLDRREALLAYAGDRVTPMEDGAGPKGS